MTHWAALGCTWMDSGARGVAQGHRSEHRDSQEGTRTHTGTARRAQEQRRVPHMHRGSGAERLHKAAHRMQQEQERDAQGVHTQQEHEGHTRTQEDAQEMDKRGVGDAQDAQGCPGDARRWMGCPREAEEGA